MRSTFYSVRNTGRRQPHHRSGLRFKHWRPHFSTVGGYPGGLGCNSDPGQARYHGGCGTGRAAPERPGQEQRWCRSTRGDAARMPRGGSVLRDCVQSRCCGMCRCARPQRVCGAAARAAERRTATTCVSEQLRAASARCRSLEWHVGLKTGLGFPHRARHCLVSSVQTAVCVGWLDFRILPPQSGSGVTRLGLRLV